MPAAPVGRWWQQRGHPLPQVVRNKISTHPDTLPTKIGECKARSPTHSETISKPALLRYFETREQIFLRLTAEGRRQWSADLRGDPGRRAHSTAAEVAGVVTVTLAARPVFCDLLAQASMNPSATCRSTRCAPSNS
ncbi:hypothetical protein [Streptomyces sp. TG1A-8]|uniref:hypothetical protein n=1 Tax=Streptomyces sp. TG1A-8 TaxID=3051385 RepID=UPI003463AF09